MIVLQVVYGPSILIETVDAQSLSVGETLTLMEWGNAVVVSITRDKFTVRFSSFLITAQSLPGPCHSVGSAPHSGQQELQGHQESDLVGRFSC